MRLLRVRPAPSVAPVGMTREAASWIRTLQLGANDWGCCSLASSPSLALIRRRCATQSELLRYEEVSRSVRARHGGFPLGRAVAFMDVEPQSGAFTKMTKRGRRARVGATLQMQRADRHSLGDDHLDSEPSRGFLGSTTCRCSNLTGKARRSVTARFVRRPCPSFPRVDASSEHVRGGLRNRAADVLFRVWGARSSNGH